MIIGKLFTGDNNGEKYQETNGVLVIQPIGKVIVSSNAEVTDLRQAMKRIKNIHLIRRY
jgi:hypothetical protein